MTKKNSEEKKTPGQKLQEKLCFKIENSWEGADKRTLGEIEAFAGGYKEFLDRGKTERECTARARELLEEEGFINIEELRGKGAAPGALKPGTKVFQHIREKALVFAVMGKRPPAEGLNILGAHVDSPRIDLKPNPLYEDSDFALFDTHYYGGIKKYQWTAIPLAMHGLFIGGDGKKIPLSIGEDEGDPVFTITDLLPHLAREQMQKKASEAVEGEDLDILAGSRPYRDEKAKEKVKLMLLSLLHERYGVTEKAFAGAEIEFVPAFKARDLGLDRSMIGAYGQDDRCCAYPALMAMLDLGRAGPPDRTAVCYLSDKEEIGSMGNTGAQSYGFENFVFLLLGGGSGGKVSRREGGFLPGTYGETRFCLANSSMLSADVNAAFDPTYAGVYDKKNGSFMGKGLVLSKYTGSGGKYGASDANGEYISRIQRLLDKKGVQWQFGELGKVDKGGGGTIALHAANLGIEVLDCGIPVLSMHSPFEVISKIDLHTAYRGYKVFLEAEAGV